MQNQFGKIHKKLAMLSIAQFMSVPAFIVPAILASKNQLSPHLINNIFTVEDAIEAMREDREIFISLLDRNRKENLKNVGELFASLGMISAQIDEVKKDLSKEIAEVKKEAAQAREGASLSAKLADQSLTLIDEQTQFIDKGFVRREAYSDAIYNELLGFKEKTEASLERLEKLGEDMNSQLSELGYETVLGSGSDDIREDLAKIKHIGAALGELNCLGQYDSLKSNTGIELALKSHLLDVCRGPVENAITA